MEPFIFYTLKSSLCLSAGYFLYYLLLRRETFHRFNRFVLLGIILISIIVPVIKMPTESAIINIPVQKLESTLVREAPVIVPDQRPAQFPHQQPERKPVNFLLLIYMAGAAIQLILIFHSLARIILLLRKSKKITYQSTRLALISSDVVPFCFGRQIVISEKDFTENNKEVILHEQTHLREGHGLDLLISELYLIITWYSPVSWMIRHELKQNHEFEADRNVLRQGIDESDYQLLLVRTVAGATRYHLANQFNQSSIKTRITMMNKRKSNPRAIFKALLFLPIIALMIQVFAQKELIQTGSSPNNYFHRKYLELTLDQLKYLGFQVNPAGLFYKNMRPDRLDKRTLCLYFTDSIYSASRNLDWDERITGLTIQDQILKKQVLTKFDFYPLIVAWINGNWTLVNTSQYNPNQKLLPIQINMANLKMMKRTDTLVFWFKPTESLKKMLSPIVKVDDYLQPCPPNGHQVKQNIKKL